MAIDVMMPALSPTMEKGTLARWLVAVGDTVKPGDLLAEIETDKATMEFEAIDEGTIAQLLIEEGTDDVPVGTVIARISDGQETVVAAPEQHLSPSARRAAKGAGIDPSSVNGTGKDGRITKEDVIAAKATLPAAASAPAAAAQDITMPALSPTMEKGTIARWLVSVGSPVRAGDNIAEIETDKATMELEASVDGTLSEILHGDGSDDIAVGTVIARVSQNGSVATAAPAAAPAPSLPVAGGGEVAQQQPSPKAHPVESAATPHAVALAVDPGLSPLIGRIAAARGLHSKSLVGTGPGGKIVLADVAPKARATEAAVPAVAPVPLALATPVAAVPAIPHDTARLSNMRKTIARRLTESKQQVPHIYLTVDVRLDALLKLRTELNAALTDRGIKLSVNDLVIKAQALALLATPACNVQFTPDTLIRFSRADISVAVSIPDGLITPVIVDAGALSLSAIAGAMKDLAGRAREGKLQPHEYQGGTASLSNLGMFGIKQFEAIINPPQAMILAVGAGERRVVPEGDETRIANVMTVTGSFDHRAIDGADAAVFMGAFRSLIENPLGLLG